MWPWEATKTNICELVGYLIVLQWSRIIDKENRIIQRQRTYHHKRTERSQTRQKTRKTFALKQQGFKITIKTNLEIYKLPWCNTKFRKRNIRTLKKKENDTPIYIDTSSNHPPSIIKQIPISINRRLSSKIDISNCKKNIYTY